MNLNLKERAIAGIIAGIVGIFFVYAFIALGVYEAATGSVIRWYASQIGFNLVWGAIFGALYVKFQNQIPGKGISKGLVFGLLLWAIHGIYPAIFHLTIVSPPWVSWALGWMIGSFVVRVLGYGLVLGVLYKK